ncbi:hypothetical protein IAU59_003402 [Kwoniella sp. CBS 9459]
MSDLQDITHLHGHAVFASCSKPLITTKAPLPSHSQAKAKARPSPMSRTASAPAKLLKSSMAVPTSMGLATHRTYSVSGKKSGSGPGPFLLSKHVRQNERPALPRFWSAVSDTLILSQRAGSSVNGTTTSTVTSLKRAHM